MKKVERLVRLAEHYEQIGRPDLAGEVDAIIATRFAQQLAPQPVGPGQPATLEQLRGELRARQQARATTMPRSKAQMDNSVFEQDPTAAAGQGTSNVVQTRPNKQTPPPAPANATPAVAPVPATATASTRLRRVAMPISRDEAVSLQEAFGPNTSLYEAYEPEEVIDPMGHGYEPGEEREDWAQPPADMAASIKHHLDSFLMDFEREGNASWGGDDGSMLRQQNDQRREWLTQILGRIRELGYGVVPMGTHDFQVVPVEQTSGDVQQMVEAMLPEDASWDEDDLEVDEADLADYRQRHDTDLMDYSAVNTSDNLMRLAGKDSPWFQQVIANMMSPTCPLCVKAATRLHDRMEGEMDFQEITNSIMRLLGKRGSLCGDENCPRQTEARGMVGESRPAVAKVSDVLLRTAEKLTTPPGYGNVDGFGGPAPQTQSQPQQIKDVPGFWQWFHKELAGGNGKDVDARRRYVQQRARGWMAPFVAPWAAKQYYDRALQYNPGQYPYLPTENELHRDDEAEEILTGKKPQGIW